MCAMIRNEGVSQLTRHWEQWEQFVRECFMRRILSPIKIGTDDEIADAMTKPIAKEDPKVKRFRNFTMNVK